MNTQPAKTALAAVAQLRTEAASMRKPEGDVVAELANEIAAAITIEKLGRAAVPEPYAASLLGLVTALQPLEEKQWFSSSIAVCHQTHFQVQDVRNALAIAKRHLGLTA